MAFRRRPVTPGQKATLAVIAAGVYAGALANGFVFDDLPQVLENPWIERWAMRISQFRCRHWEGTKKR